MAPIRDYIAATSIGIVDGEIMLDLCYEEDARAEVDMNLVMTGSKKIVEVQATAERHPFDDAATGEDDGPGEERNRVAGGKAAGRADRAAATAVRTHS